MYTMNTGQKDPKKILEGSEKIFSYIIDCLVSQQGGIIGRHGSTELTLLLIQEQFPSTLDSVRAEMLEQYSGIFPTTSDSILHWLKTYKEATQESDIFAAGWYIPLAKQEINYLRQLHPSQIHIPLRSLEPYYTENSWMRALEGQRVTVVSSFADTMKEQVKKHIQLWEGKYVLPTADWKFVRSYYCPRIAKGRCQWPEGITSWESAVDYLEAEVLATHPRVVLLGCGGLAMPLAMRLKKKGILSIILGGAVQILFGIKGKRWESHPVISQFFNDSWVFPSDDETPGGYEKIEGGCYW